MTELCERFTKQGKKWDTAHVNRILSNHTYVGEIKYRDAICQGEQEAIIERNVWERVKEIQRSIDPQSDHSRRQEKSCRLFAYS